MTISDWPIIVLSSSFFPLLISQCSDSGLYSSAWSLAPLVHCACVICLFGWGIPCLCLRLPRKASRRPRAALLGITTSRIHFPSKTNDARASWQKFCGHPWKIIMEASLSLVQSVHSRYQSFLTASPPPLPGSPAEFPSSEFSRSVSMRNSCLTVNGSSRTASP